MGKKHIYKRPPVEFYDLAGAERWLEKMAARGLTLYRWGTWRCKFEVGEPRTVRCRLDPNRIKGWSPGLTGEFEELKESYRAAGWEYVCTIGSFYLFESADPDAPELYTDPESKALSLRLLTRQSVRGMVANLLLCALALLPFLLGADYGTDFFSRYDPRRYYALILCPFLAFDACWTAWFLRKLRGALRRGEALPKPPRWHRRFERAYEIVICLLCCVTLIVVAAERGYDKQRVTLSNSLIRTPWLTIEEVEELDALEERGILVKEDGFRGWAHPLEGNYLAYEPSFLTPAHVLISQEGTIQSIWWDELIPDIGFVGRYRPHLAMEFWELRYTSMAPEFYEHLIAQNERWLTVTPLVVPRTDEAALAVSDDGGARQIVLLRRGGRVAEISYYGAGTLTEHLDSVAAMLAADWRTPEYLLNREKGN